MSTVKANTYQDASGGSNAVFSGVASPPNGMGFRNRIINGDCRVDQRNAGASVTPTTANNVYPIDRFVTIASQASKYTAQQNAGSVTPPAGFTNYLGFTSSSAYSVGASESFYTVQRVEGFNFADMAWGTANAQTVTLSFWVRSSLTGVFGTALWNSAASRAYPVAYTINAANTWEYKTITIPGDTTGTWIGATNGIGVNVAFGLGLGSSISGTSGAWNAGTAFMPTGATSVVGTNGATFYITGVQLEAGTVASPFERRDYGRELMMCQRYFQPVGTGFSGRCSSTSGVEFSVGYRVQMRANATVTYGGFSGAATQFDAFGTAGTQTMNGGTFSSPISWATGCYFSVSVSGTPLTAGAPAFLIRGDVASASAEL